MKHREEFVLRALEPNANIADLCREYAVSRKTGYKWIGRFKKLGVAGLEDESRRPRDSPHATAGTVVEEIVRLRVAHPTWGPKKLKPLLEAIHGKAPSLNTIARVLTRTGLSHAVKRTRRAFAEPDGGRLPVHVRAANDLWTVDFKGWWRTGDQARCEPLSVRDAFSRFVLELRALPDTRTESVRARFIRLFKAHGSPKAILVDNGPPFGTTQNPLGLTALSAWWWSLGIQVHHTRPAKPQDNGGHERMHADIANEVETSRMLNIRAQQAVLDRWRHEFNHHRPHEALGQRPPAAFYKRSARRWSPHYKPPKPRNAAERRLGNRGQVFFRGESTFISGALAFQTVALEPLDMATYRVWFGHLLIGWLRVVTTSASRELRFEWAQRLRPLVKVHPPRRGRQLKAAARRA